MNYDGYSQFVLNCVGLYDGDYLDKLEADFEIEICWTETEMQDIIRDTLSSSNLFNYIASEIFNRVIEKAVIEFDARESDFDYCCNGTLDTYINCKRQEVYSWQDIEELYKRKKHIRK